MRAKGHLAAVLALLLGIAPCSLGAAPPPPDEIASALATALFREALSLSKRGDWASAASLLRKARAQDEGDSDIRYLSALADLETGAALGDALAELDAALASGRFAAYCGVEARLLKAELLVRLRRWDEALPLLGDSGLEPDLEPRRSLARAKAFLGAGAERACIDELDRALRRHPDDPSFPRFVFETAASGPRALPDSPALRSLVDLALSRVERCAISEPELPVMAAPYMADRAAAANAVLAFRAAGGMSAAATLLALEYGLADEARAAAELFSGAYPLRSGDFVRALGLARSPAGRASFAGSLAVFTGRIETDSDGDGLVDHACDLSNGRAAFFADDIDQDGMPDLEVSFVGGLPARAVIVPAGLSFEYGEYPAIEAVRAARDGSETLYELEPGTLHYSPVLMSPIAGEGGSAVFLPFPTGESAPTERAVAASALRRRESRGEIEELVYLDRSLALRREIRQKGRLILVTDYRLGQPVGEKADLDGDGRFETERGYAADAPASPAAPELAWARVDADGDGLFEYREDARFPFRKEWDLDANGSVDAVEYRDGEGLVMCLYSSRLDGAFDEELRLRDGEIIAFSKGGFPIALVPDENPSLVWIGVKPFDLGADRVPEPGLHSRGELRYRIVRGDRRLFAEILP